MTTVLVVEDERGIRDVLRRYLERAGFGVLTTGSGAEALSIVRESPVDLVVLDLGLPDIDGEDVLRELREHDSPPVLVLTARGELADRILGLELGADDYVTKPCSAREVVLRVQAILHRSERGAASTEVARFGGGGCASTSHATRRPWTGVRSSSPRASGGSSWHWPLRLAASARATSS